MIPFDTLTSIHALLSGLLAAIDKDFINGSFELLAGFFVLNHCRVLHLHKAVRGVSLASVLFFTLWGIWNLYYYPALNQPLSFYGGLFVVPANAFWVGMMVRYRSSTFTTNGKVFPPKPWPEPPEQIDEYALYLGVESNAFPRSGDQA